MRYYVLLILVLCSCSSNREVITNGNEKLNSVSSIDLNDSTTISNSININSDVAVKNNTIIEENIIEEITDSATSIKRSIQRVIKQETGNSISCEIVQQSDTTLVQNDKTLETKDYGAITSNKDVRSESSRMKYIFYVGIIIFLTYIIYKFF